MPELDFLLRFAELVLTALRIRDLLKRRRKHDDD